MISYRKDKETMICKPPYGLIYNTGDLKIYRYKEQYQIKVGENMIGISPERVLELEEIFRNPVIRGENVAW